MENYVGNFALELVHYLLMHYLDNIIIFSKTPEKLLTLIDMKHFKRISDVYTMVDITTWRCLEREACLIKNGIKKLKAFGQVPSYQQDISFSLLLKTR